jgi:flagellar biosynthesis component FlhA
MQVGGTAGKNLIYLNVEADQEDATISRKELGDKRQAKVDQKIKALEKTEEGGKIRGDAADTQSEYQTAAATLGAAAAVCACFPPIGTIIGAVLAAVAAVVMLIGYLKNQGKQQEAAGKDKEAGQQNVKAEQLDADIQKNVEDRRTRREQLQQSIQAELQMESEQREIQRGQLS